MFIFFSCEMQVFSINYDIDPEIVTIINIRASIPYVVGDICRFIEYLKRCTKLERFTMRQFRCKHYEWQRIIDALPMWNLKVLDVSFNNDHDLFGGTNVLQFCDEMKLETLRNIHTLDLSHSHFSEYDHKYYWQLYETDVIPFLQNTTSLKVLRLDHCWGLEDTRVIPDGIGKNRSLEILSIEKCHPDIKRILQETVAQHPYIQSVLPWNSSRDALLRVKRNEIRKPLLSKSAIAMANNKMPLEMTTIIIDCMDIPVQYKGN